MSQFADKAIRVGIVQLYIATFNEPLYANLASTPGYDVTLIHGENAETDLTPSVMKQFAFKTTFVRNAKISIGGFDLRYQVGGLKALRKGAFDVVICEGTFGIISNWLLAVYCKLNRIPFIWWVCGWEKQAKGLRKTIKSFIVSRLVRLASVSLTYGSRASQYLTDHGFDKTRIILAQNTIDTRSVLARKAEFVQEGISIRRKLGLTEAKVILFVGGLGKSKRVDVLLTAFKELSDRIKNVALVIVGDGSERMRLEDFVKSANLKRVFFIGQLFDGVNPYFALCDIFVLPGLGGLAINQAMVFGKPVISASADGTEIDLIEDGKSGFLLKDQSSTELARYLIQLLTDETSLSAMGKASERILLDKATIEKQTESFLRGIDLALAAEN